MTHFAFLGATKFPSLSYIGAQSPTTGPATFTVPAIKGNQWAVFVACYLGATRTFTCNSVSLTKLVEGANTAGSPNIRTCILIFQPTAGTTSLSIDGSTTGAIGYALYIVSDLINGGAASATGATSGTGSTLSSMTAPAHALLISSAFEANQTSQPTGCTWSGGTTTDALNTHTFGVTNFAWGPGSAANVSAGSYTLSFSFTGGGLGSPVGCGVALR